MQEIFIVFIKWCMMPYVVTLCIILLIGFIWSVQNGKWVILEKAKAMTRPMSGLLDRFMGKLPTYNKNKDKN